MPEVVESDEKPPERYRRLMVELLMARDQADGRLSPVEEARRADELNRVWWTMTDREQNEYEQHLARTIAKVWRNGSRVVPLGPEPGPEPPEGARPAPNVTFDEWLRRRRQRRITRALARQASRTERPPPDWLDEKLVLPRWVVLLGWALHVVLMFWLGRLSVTW